LRILGVAALLACLAGVVAPGVAAAGVEMTLRQRHTGIQELETTSTLKAQAGVIRIQDEDDPIYLLWDTRRREFHQVDTEADVCTGGDFEAQLALMKKILLGLMPEPRGGRREPAAGGTTAGDRPRFSATRTGEMAEVAGLQAERYEIREGGSLRQELWIGEWPALSREVDMAVLRGMQQAWMNVIEQIMSGGEGDPILEWYLSGEYARLFEKGVALRQVEYLPEGNLVSETTSAVVREIVPAELTLPAKCRRVSLEEFMDVSEE
jgi:hypothetical protein